MSAPYQDLPPGLFSDLQSQVLNDRLRVLAGAIGAATTVVSTTQQAASVVKRPPVPLGGSAAGDSSALPLALPSLFSAAQEFSVQAGAPSVRYVFRAVIPSEPDGWEMDVMHSFWTDATYTTIITKNDGPGWDPDGWGRMIEDRPRKSLIGTSCTITGTAVHRGSGDDFESWLEGMEVLFGAATIATVATVTDADNLVLVTAPGDATLAYQSLWTKASNWFTQPTTESTYNPWYQGFRPRMIDKQGKTLDPTGTDLTIFITTPDSDGFDGKAIAPGTIDLTQVDFSKISAVLGVFADLFGIAPGSIDSSKINYIDFAKITNVIITNAMIQSLAIGKLTGTGAAAFSGPVTMQVGGSSGGALSIDGSGATIYGGGGEILVNSGTVGMTSSSGTTRVTLTGIDAEIAANNGTVHVRGNVVSLEGSLNLSGASFSSPSGVRTQLGLGSVATHAATEFASSSDISNLQSQINALSALLTLVLQAHNGHTHTTGGVVSGGPSILVSTS